MGKFDDLLDDIEGRPRGTTTALNILSWKKRPSPLAKSISDCNTALARVQKSRRALMKSMPTMPTVEDHRRTFDRVSAAVDRGISEGRLSAGEVAQLEVHLNNYARQNRL